MTAHALVEERQRCLDAGMNDHVSKPIDPDVLFATLMRWAHPRVAESSAEPKAGEKPTVEVKKTIEVKKTDAPAEIIVPEIEDVDVAGGVKRVAGNKKLYRDLLTQFAEKQGDAGSQIAEALQSGDAKLAERIAHTVKGVAGNLGIATVQLSAGLVEKAVREGDPATGALLSDFSKLLQTQVSRVAAALSATQPVAAAAPVVAAFDADTASEAAARLKELLDASDGDSEEAFGVFRDASGGKLDSATLSALGDSIRDFDFESATAQLEKIVQELGLNAGKATA